MLPYALVKNLIKKWNLFSFFKGLLESLSDRERERDRKEEGGIKRSLLLVHSPKSHNSLGLAWPNPGARSSRRFPTWIPGTQRLKPAPGASQMHWQGATLEAE